MPQRWWTLLGVQDIFFGRVSTSKNSEQCMHHAPACLASGNAAMPGARGVPTRVVWVACVPAPTDPTRDARCLSRVQHFVSTATTFSTHSGVQTPAHCLVVVCSSLNAGP